MGRSGELARGTADEKGLKFDLREEVFDDVAVDVGEAEVAAGVGVGEFFVIEAEEVEDGGVEVVDGGDIDGGAAAEFVGLAIADAAFDTGAHHPGGEGVGVVIASAGAFLMGGHAAEFGAPDDEDIVQHAALFEIGEEGGGGLIEDGTMAFVVGFEGFVGIPVEEAVDGAGA